MRRCVFLLFGLTLSWQVFCQSGKVTVSGTIVETGTSTALPYVNVIIKKSADSTFVAGTVTSDHGLFALGGITPGDYVLETSFVGFKTKKTAILVGRLSDYLDLGTMALDEDVTALES